MTVAQLLERHHERHVKPGAKADFARHSRRLLEHFGDAVIADLTPAAIDGFTSAMRATGRGGSYVDRILDSLRSALSKAHRLGEITAAPLSRPSRATATSGACRRRRRWPPSGRRPRSRTSGCSS